MAATKPHNITVTVTSESNGVTNQVISLVEYAKDEKELVVKSFAYAEAIAKALIEANKTLAAAYKK